MAAEAGTAESPRYRASARAVVIRDDGRVLLLLSEFDGRQMWFAPGGGLEPGETPEQAALRELREEVGIDGAEIGPLVWHRRARWYHAEADTWYDGEEWFYLVRLATTDDALRPLIEQDGIVRLHEARWWSLDDLNASADLVSPRALRDLLEPLVRGEVPPEVVEVGL